MARVAPPAPRLRRRRRGLARGRDRDRRLAPRRAVRPARRADRGRGRRLEGLGALGRRVRPARRARRVLGAPRALRRPSRGGRPDDRARSASRRSPRRSPRTPTRCSPTRTCEPLTRVDAIVAGRKLEPRLCAELGTARAVRPRQPGRDRCSSTAASSPTSAPSATASTSASASGSAGATRARRSRSAWAASSTASAAPGRYDVAFRLQENRWNGTVAPQLVVRRVFDADDRFDELRDWLADQWRARRAPPGRPRRARSSTELELDERRAAEPARVADVPGAARAAAGVRRRCLIEDRNHAGCAAVPRLEPWLPRRSSRRRRSTT